MLPSMNLTSSVSSSFVQAANCAWAVSTLYSVIILRALRSRPRSTSAFSRASISGMPRSSCSRSKRSAAARATGAIRSYIL